MTDKVFISKENLEKALSFKEKKDVGFFTSIFSRLSLSASALASASFTMFSISLSDKPVESVMVIFCSLLVPLSLAVTFKMPFASMSKVTSICGIPRGAGGIPSR